MRHKATCGNNHRSYVTKQTFSVVRQKHWGHEGDHTHPPHLHAVRFGGKEETFYILFLLFSVRTFSNAHYAQTIIRAFFVICWKLSWKNWRASFLPVIGRVKISSEKPIKHETKFVAHDFTLKRNSLLSTLVEDEDIYWLFATLFCSLLKFIVECSGPVWQ